MKKIRLPFLLICFCLILPLVSGCYNDLFKLIGPVYLSEIESEVLDQINQYRVSKGLSTLTASEPITREARKHSRNMANGIVPFGHEGFEARIQATGIAYLSAAENVAYNYGYADPASIAVNGWILSQGHRQNIEGNFNLTGIGVIENDSGTFYLTQIFMRTP